MGLRFNPSSTDETRGLVNNVTDLAKWQWQQDEARKQQEEQNKQQLFLLQKMGLIDGMPETSATPVAQMPTVNAPQASGVGGLGLSKPLAPVQEPVKSLKNGGVGDINGRPVFPPMSRESDAMSMNQSPVAPMSLQPAATQQPIKKTSRPFIAIPNPKGGYSIQKNPDYKNTQASSITTFDQSSIKTPKTDEERQAAIESLPPDLAENVKAAGEYRLDPNKLYSMRSNSADRTKFDALVNKIYPGWSMQKYSQRQAYMNDLAKGKTSQSILALNTLAKHMETFDNTIDELKNGNIKPENAIINFAKDVTGDPTITDFKFAKEIVNSELERLLTGVGVTQQGMERVNKMLSTSAGYKQMKSASQLLKTIVRGRIEPLRTQYKNMMGEEENGQILFPESQKVFAASNNSDNIDSNNSSPITGKTKSGLSYTISR